MSKPCQTPQDAPEHAEPPLPTSPEQLLACLEALGIQAVTHHHPPLFTVEESKALRGTLPGGHCKSLFLKDKKGQLWLLVADEDRRIELNRLHVRLGSARLSFASAELLWRVLGVRPGSVTPFALINDREHRVAVALDRDMMNNALVNYHPLRNDRTTALPPADLLRFIEACGHAPHLVDLGPEDDGTPDRPCGP